MLSRVLKEVKLPFPDDFFPEMEVSPQQQSDYHHTAFRFLHQTLQDEQSVARQHPSQQPEQWKCIGERVDLKLFRERGVPKGRPVQVMILGTLVGSLEDVMWGLYAANSGSMKTQRSIMHSDFLDAAVLHVLEEDPYSEEDTAFTYRFAGLKWLACAPTGKLVHKRDLCWYEEMGIMKNPQGEEFGYLVMQSARLQECPPYELLGVKRSTASVCYNFRPMPNGTVSVFMKGSHMVGGKSRSWSSDAVMVEMWLAIANVLECVQSKRLSRLVYDKELFCAMQAGRTCEMCDTRLKLLKTGQNCKICGKNVCERCRMTKAIYPNSQMSPFPCSYFFCKRCLVDTNDRFFGRATRMSYQSEVSSPSYQSSSPRYRSMMRPDIVRMQSDGSSQRSVSPSQYRATSGQRSHASFNSDHSSQRSASPRYRVPNSGQKQSFNSDYSSQRSTSPRRRTMSRPVMNFNAANRPTISSNSDHSSQQSVSPRNQRAMSRPVMMGMAAPGGDQRDKISSISKSAFFVNDVEGKIYTARSGNTSSSHTMSTSNSSYLDSFNLSGDINTKSDVVSYSTTGSLGAMSNGRHRVEGQIPIPSSSGGLSSQATMQNYESMYRSPLEPTSDPVYPKTADTHGRRMEGRIPIPTSSAVPNTIVGSQRRMQKGISNTSMDSTYDVNTYRETDVLSSDGSDVLSVDDYDEYDTYEVSGNASLPKPHHRDHNDQLIEVYNGDDDTILEIPRAVSPEPEESACVFQDDNLKYINAFRADSDGSVASGGGSKGSTDADSLMERLLQINMTAEATYLMAKYNANIQENLSSIR